MHLSTLRSVLIGVLLSAGPIAVLAHGIFGAGSILTGLLLTCPVVLLVVLGDWSSLRPNICDALYAAFVCCVGLSLAFSGYADKKEVSLLALSVAAYPAGRLSGQDIQSQGMLAVAVPVLIAGTLATAFALVVQWSAAHGKPMVFGQFDAAPAQFSMLLGAVILMAATSDKLSLRQMVLVGITAAIPVAIFAASMVRFTFIALAISLAFAAILNPSTVKRRTIVSVLVIGALAIAIGLAGRWQTTSIFISHAVAATGGNDCQAVDRDNSIAIRKQLYVDALSMLPNAGPLGIGLDRFAERGCVKGLGTHNTLLQIALEFGWIAGIIFAALIILALGASFSMTAISQEFRFAACYIIFNLLLSTMHGRPSREMVLFFVLGYAAKLREMRMDIATTFLLKPFRT